MDLVDLQFVDSSGLGFLFKLQRHLIGQGRRLVLCKLQPPVRQLIEITRLTTLFQIAETRQQALAMLGLPLTEAVA